MAEYVESNGYGKEYINFKIDRSMYCIYDGDCRVSDVIFEREICNFCIWKKKIDIQKMLEDK